MGIKKIAIEDQGYPKNLRNIHAPPKALYVNGSMLPQDEVAVAVVGSRRATPYGIEMSDKIGFELALRGVTVVSGMARGVDSAAHRGAIRAKGRTIAVMGSGHGTIYPPENDELYEEITASGAVVTEYEDDMPPLPNNFPARNRIISGLSLGIVVVEAARNSGALITANFAAEQGREVFAVPGKISSQTSGGTNDLIKDGARLISSVDDILEELKIVELKGVPEEERRAIDGKIEKATRAYIYNSLTEDERKIYRLLSDEPVHVDDILSSSGLNQASASKAMLNLQLKKLVKEMPGKQFIRTESAG